MVQRQVEDEEEEELIQAKTLDDTTNFALQRQLEDEEEDLVQTKPINSSPQVMATDIQHQIQSMHGSGQPISPSERAFFEPRFGADFSHVKIHNNQPAVEAAQALNARAFTLGSNLFFGAGQLIPASREGKRLMAHELTHVIQQGNLSVPGILQRRVDGEVSPRDAVLATIEAFRNAEQAEELKAVTWEEKTLRHQLKEWRRRSKKAEKQIQKELSNDPSLLIQLQEAYIHAVNAIITQAASQQAQDPQEIYYHHRKQIREWVAIRDPQASQLSDLLPKEERQRIRVFNSSSFDPQDISGAIDSTFSFSKDRVYFSLPEPMAVEFGGAIPKRTEAFRTSLKHLAMNLISLLDSESNITFTIVLNLKPYVNEHAAYRFTYIVNEQPRTYKLLIERLGTAGVEVPLPSELTLGQEAFKAHHFIKGKGWKGQDAAFDLVLQALTNLPEALLSVVDGATFHNSPCLTGVTAPAHMVKSDSCYVDKEHAIYLDSAIFTESPMRFGAPGENMVGRVPLTTIHEIGHVIDRRSQREAEERQQLALEQYQRLWDAFREEFREFKTSSGQYWFRRSKDSARFDQRKQELQEAKDTLQNAEDALSRTTPLSEIGEDETFQIVTESPEAGANTFRQAFATDGGMAVTTYAEDEWSEQFAEAFALYVLDPETLHRLRPTVFAYFQTNFPESEKTQGADSK